MVHIDDIRKRVIKGNKYRTEYRASCDTCGTDRGYMSKQNAIKYPNCKRCSHKNISTETREKISKASKGRIPWNKGKKGISDSTREKMRAKKLGRTPHNMGKSCSTEQKIKLSCVNRGISIDDFDDFTNEESKRERNKFTDLNLHKLCFEKYGYACDRCGLDKVILNAHHKNSWKHFPNLRFDMSNLVALCYTCHKTFHSLYGNGKSAPNTDVQYDEFKHSFVRQNIKKKIILVAGAAGSGKTWVCNNLSSRIHYHQYDKNNRSEARSMLWNLDAAVIAYDPFSHVSTFIKKNSDIFDIHLYVIQESMAVVKQRLEGRGGQYTKSVERRIKRMKNLAKMAIFSGTSSEVLEEILRSIS